MIASVLFPSALSCSALEEAFPRPSGDCLSFNAIIVKLSLNPGTLFYRPRFQAQIMPLILKIVYNTRRHAFEVSKRNLGKRKKSISLNVQQPPAVTFCMLLI